MLKKFLVSLLILFSLFSLHSQERRRIISPVSGTFCNRQPLIIDIKKGEDCFYSLTGSEPLESGLAYDGPFVIESEGDVELNVVIASGDNFEEYKIKYTVDPVPETETSLDAENPSVENQFIRKIINSPIQELFTDESFVIPESFRYSFDDEVDPYLKGKELKLDSSNKFFRFVPVTCVLEDMTFHFVLKVIGSDTGLLAKNEIPFEIQDWTNFRFTGEKLIWSLDGGLWSADRKPFFVDRTVPHVISWQDVAYEKGNPVSRFTLPVVPSVNIEGGGREPLKVTVSGDESYKVELVSGGENLNLQENYGLFDEICLDVFEGESVSSEAVVAVYSDGVFQGTINVPYSLDKLPPRAPQILSSTKGAFSRDNVNIIINGDFGCDFYVAKSDGLKIADANELGTVTTEKFLEDVKISDFEKYVKDQIQLTSDGTGPVFYKLVAFARDSLGNQSEDTVFSIVIDENNFYLSEKKEGGISEDKENGSYLSPFTSFDKIVDVINSGKFTRVYVDGVIPVGGKEKRITSNCEFISIKDAHFVFNPDTSLKITASSVDFKGCIIEKVADTGGFENTRNFLTFENSTSVFTDCELVCVFSESGVAIDSRTSVLKFYRSGLTSQGDSYTSAISATRSKIFADLSRFSTVAQTSVNFSMSNSVFEMKGSDCKVSGKLGRIGEFNSSEIKIFDNILAGNIERMKKTVPLNPMWIDSKSKIFEDKGNLIYGF